LATVDFDQTLPEVRRQVNQIVSQDVGRFASVIRVFDSIYPTSERVTLPRVNPVDDYDEKKFKERFRPR